MTKIDWDQGDLCHLSKSKRLKPMPHTDFICDFAQILPHRNEFKARDFPQRVLSCAVALSTRNQIFDKIYSGNFVRVSDRFTRAPHTKLTVKEMKEKRVLQVDAIEVCCDSGDKSFTETVEDPSLSVSSSFLLSERVPNLVGLQSVVGRHPLAVVQ